MDKCRAGVSAGRLTGVAGRTIVLDEHNRWILNLDDMRPNDIRSATREMAPGPHGRMPQGGRIRLRTLVLIRWLAITGQSVALLLVHFGLGYELAIFPALALVAASALLNVALGVGWSAATRLHDRGAAFLLGYDILQLAGLIFLTGGLHNPFALLFLVPVTISATMLNLRSTVYLGALGMLCISLLAFFHEPLPWPGEGLQLPALYIAGIWFALAIGTAFLAAYAWRVAAEARRMSDALSATQLALSREQRLSALGSLAAAAAHELGTPLGTIAVVTKELKRDLPDGSPFGDDVDLLSSQAERCRDILARLSQRPDTQDDQAFHAIPLDSLVDMAVNPHRRNGIAATVHVIDEVDAALRSNPPLVMHKPEIVHGLGNLVENAMDFARATVDVGVSWTDREARVIIRDDGPGLSLDVLDMLGEPYMTTRREAGGMGLGVFIAKTLLERTGASLRFANRKDGGAEVAITWPRGILEELEIRRQPAEP